MNTPAHAILNLALLGRGADRDHAPAILAGALLPDLPMFGFYLWNRLVVGASQSLIWGDLYFRATWQTLFDVFNSIPLAAAGALVAWRIHPGRASRTTLVVICSVSVVGWLVFYGLSRC